MYYYKVNGISFIVFAGHVQTFFIWSQKEKALLDFCSSESFLQILLKEDIYLSCMSKGNWIS